LDFVFKTNFEVWARDKRYKAFVLRQRIANMYFAEMRRVAEKVAAQAKRIPIYQGDMADLKFEQIGSSGTNNSMRFRISFPHHARFVIWGRNPGNAPISKLIDWVEHRFELTGKDAWGAALGVRNKLIKVGFNKNKAPYIWMQQIFGSSESQMELAFGRFVDDSFGKIHKYIIDETIEWTK